MSRPGLEAPRELRFAAGEQSGPVSALLLRPAAARWLLVFGHGAGAGMRHRFMEDAAAALARAGVASLRYQFPYMEAGRRRPDPQRRLIDTVRAAVDSARAHAPELPLLAGGKSMGGRMTSLAAADSALPGVRGLVFFGFPLHPTGKPGLERAQHLRAVELPMLFLQGTRDRLADLSLLRRVCAGLGSAATLHIVEDADHSFGVLKRTGRTRAEVIDELTRTVSGWAARLDSGA